MTQLKTLALADFESEMAATRRVIERVPDEKLAWAPHQKSRTLGDLAAHVVEIVSWLPLILERNELDFGGAPPPSVVPESRRSLLERLEESIHKAREALDTVSADELARDWTLRVGDRVIFTSPKLVVLRSFGIGHLGHHRGQLTVYLRLLDVPVPSVFGPTADEA
jgi:uncharacterized damage-inducible protein DinB